MKLVIILALATVVVAAPAQDDGIDTYNFAYEPSDGSNHGSDDENLALQGSYSYMSRDRTPYIVTYTADEDGFQPQVQKGPGNVKY